jgi:protocatechuate 3,4-dioxygenase, beta subunit
VLKIFRVREDTMNPQGISRRQMLGMALGVHAFALAGSWSPARAETLKRTPNQILGPFYPLDKPPAEVSDLVMVPGRSGRAAGQVIHVMGRVLNVDAKPIAGARVELWQANAWGRYRHPSDTNSAPLDPNFDGFAVQVTDAEGRYHFKTIKPAAYPTGPNTMRPAHIHFEVTGKTDRLVTQMYFAGDSWNDKDPFLQSAGAGKERLIVKLQPPGSSLEPDSLLAAWDIVVYRGWFSAALARLHAVGVRFAAAAAFANCASVTL